MSQSKKFEIFTRKTIYKLGDHRRAVPDTAKLTVKTTAQVTEGVIQTGIGVVILNLNELRDLRGSLNDFFGGSE